MLIGMAVADSGSVNTISLYDAIEQAENRVPNLPITQTEVDYVLDIQERLLAGNI